MSSQTKIEFKVAAKTARLIGRESISSAEGAVIELVKNSYDADAGQCQICIFSKYESLPNSLSICEYENVLNDSPEKAVLEDNYELSPLQDAYILKDKVSASARSSLEEIFSQYNYIIIADNGDGMTSDIIEDHWMTIGTNAKEVDSITQHGRVKSGAKGVGRFALDKLGKNCEMFTRKKGEKSCVWTVSWDDFENKETLNEVTAELLIKDFSLADEFLKITGENKSIYNQGSEYGTLICVRGLREFWPKNKISKLYENLKSLLPPIEESDFVISLHSNLYSEDFGELSYSDYNEYDWKLSANIKGNDVELTFFPAEYDKKKFDADFFNSDLYKKEPIFSRDEFFKGQYSKHIKLSDLIPGSVDNDELSRTLSNLGDFQFSAYFLKRTQSADDREKYFYKNFNAKLRNSWLEQNGGVKIYRDHMRVRPYGIGHSFDWLKLDERAAASPAAPSRKGQWRVRAHQLAGTAHISRVTNPGIADQTNREGLIENQHLAVFKNLLISLIKELEDQRSFVAYVLDDLFKKKNEQAHILDQSDRVIENHKTQDTKKPDLFSESTKSSDEEKIDVLVKRAKIQDEKIDILTEQNKLLRVLASSGAMISSFAHDFKKVSNTLSSRHTDLVKLLERYNLDLDGVDIALNPFEMIKDMEKQDKKLNAWLRLTLDTLKQDRRKSKNVNLEEYFNTLKRFWDTHLTYRGASLETVIESSDSLKCFEIDLDSIFNNLISNSYEAFKRLGFKGEKKIRITSRVVDSNLEITYEDTGPGLSPTIKQASKIFEPLFTTKTDNEGNQIGTGLGMTLVQGSVDDLNGHIELLSQLGDPGFKLKITIPTNSKRGG